jgi:IS4 transposase
MKFFLFQTLEFDLSLLIDSNNLSYFIRFIYTCALFIIIIIIIYLKLIKLWLGSHIDRGYDSKFQAKSTW